MDPASRNPVRSTRLWSRVLLLVSAGLGGAALILLLWPYAPRAKLPLQNFVSRHPALAKAVPAPLQPPNLTPPLSGNWLIIPSINVKEQILEGKSLDVLWTHEGVWRQTGDTQHNLVLAGHRFQYLPPNTDTFYDLGKLKKGDEVSLVQEGKTSHYTVTRIFTVTPEHTEILNPTPYPELTLYTCADWKATERLVVVARPV